MSECLPSPSPANSTPGIVLLANNAAAILYGITTVQTFVYFRNNPNDRPLLKYIVFFLWILATLHLAFIIHVIYHYTANSSNPAQPIWSVSAQAYVTSLNDIFVRAVFARRVWLLSGKKTYTIALIAIPSVIAPVVGSVHAFRTPKFHTLVELRQISTLLYLGLSAGVAADITIASFLVLLLVKSRTGFKQTDSILNTLMIYAINTGLLTSAR